MCDWVNDDMPYPVKAGGRTLHAMPHSNDIEDATTLIAMHQDEDELRDQWLDHFDVLYEAKRADASWSCRCIPG